VLKLEIQLIETVEKGECLCGREMAQGTTALLLTDAACGSLRFCHSDCLFRHVLSAMRWRLGAEVKESVLDVSPAVPEAEADGTIEVVSSLEAWRICHNQAIATQKKGSKKTRKRGQAKPNFVYP